MKLYSYVIQHDFGHAPNPYWRFCTLARCKCREEPRQRANIVELADVGDWIVGTGGADHRKSAGHRNMIYAMKVEEKIRLGRYWSNQRFKDKKPLTNGDYAQRRGDNKRPKSPFEENERYALVAWDEYYYFGNHAIQIPPEFRALEKRGPGFKKTFTPEFIGQFLHWLKRNYKPGKHGEPCGQEFLSSTEGKNLKTCKPSC